MPIPLACTLVVPAFGVLEAWAAGNGVHAEGRETLVGDATVQKKMEEEVLGGLTDLASFERPKKLALLTVEFTVENGMLTPTQKVKRREVQSRFDALIDRFYEEAGADRAVFVEQGG